MLPANQTFFTDRPGLTEKLAAAADAWDIQKARSGAPVPVRRADSRWLLSRYDPGRETERWLKTQQIAEDELPIFLGCNPCVLSACTMRPLIMVERDASLLKAVLGGIDLSDHLKGVSLILDADGYDMMSAVRNAYDPFYHRRIRLLPLPHEEDTAWLKSVAENGLKIQREIGFNAMSYACQLPKWITTVRANLESAFRSPDARVLHGALTGGTAIIVGAGPSLEHNIDQLHRCRGRALIIAVDTALRRLDKAGIVPDIAVAVDANDANARDVDDLSARILDHTVLAADYIASPILVQAFHGPKTFLRSINFTFDLDGRAVPMFEPLDRLLIALSGREMIGAWQSGGSVSTNAFNLCHLLGVRRVILVGQDLAFTNDRAHAAGVGHEDDGVGKMVNRFFSREMLVRQAMRDAAFTVPGWDGELVRTNDVLREYLSWFDMTMTRGFGAMFEEVIDATEGGAAKQGMKRMRLSEALDLLESRSSAGAGAESAGQVIRDRLADAPEAGAEGWEDRVRAYAQRCRNLREASPKRIAADLPLAPWIVIPAYIGSFDMPAEERTAVKEAGLKSAVDFLAKVFGSLADALAADAPTAEFAGTPGRNTGHAAHAEPVLKPETARADFPSDEMQDTGAARLLAARLRVERAVSGDAAHGPVELLILTGIGLGDELVAAVSHASLSRMIVVEPQRDRLKSALSRAASRGVDLTQALADKRVTMISGKSASEALDELKRAFDHSLDPATHLVVLPRHAHLQNEAMATEFASEFAAGLAELETYSDRNRSTLTRFAPTWREHLLANIPALLTGGRVADLEGVAKGCAGVLVAAGPSLDRNLKALADAARRSGAGRPVIVVVDTAYRAVCAAGIVPDFVVAVDATQDNLRDFDGVTIDQERTALVYVPVVHPALPALFKRRFAASYGHPAQVWLEEVTKRRFGSLLVSGSVATIAYDLLRHLGAKPIILVGLDLAVGASLHTRGALTGARSDRFATSEMHAWKETRSATVRCAGWGGRDRVRTTEQMLRWAEWFEADLRRRPWPTVNATEGGVRIAGTTEQPLAEALSRAPTRGATIPDPHPFSGKARELVRHSLDVLVSNPDLPEAQALADALLRWDRAVRPSADRPLLRNQLRDQVRTALNSMERS